MRDRWQGRVREQLGTGYLLREGGGVLQNEKIAGPKHFAFPPSRQGKTFCAHSFKRWKLFAPPPLTPPPNQYG